VTAAHLNVAHGHVRCCHCNHVFNASHHLLGLPNEIDSSTFQHVNPDYPTNIPDDNISELLPERESNKPRYHRSWGSFLFWGIMVVLLSITLVGQMMWLWQRDSFLQNAYVRPWLEEFCYTFLCHLPPTRHLKSFHIVEHVAQIHPKFNHVVQFKAQFINNATFPQPFPDLQLTFENVNGELITQRRFKPSEYLLQSLYKSQRIQAKTSVNIQLDLVNMAKFIEENNVTVGYHFDFL